MVRAGKYKLGDRAGKYKLRAMAIKYKLGASAGKYKMRPEPGGRDRVLDQAKGRGLRNIKTLCYQDI